MGHMAEALLQCHGMKHRPGWTGVHLRVSQDRSQQAYLAGAVLHSCPNRKKGLNEENFQERSQLLLDSVIRMGGDGWVLRTPNI